MLYIVVCVIKNSNAEFRFHQNETMHWKFLTLSRREKTYQKHHHSISYNNLAYPTFLQMKNNLPLGKKEKQQDTTTKFTNAMSKYFNKIILTLLNVMTAPANIITSPKFNKTLFRNLNIIQSSWAVHHCLGHNGCYLIQGILFCSPYKRIRFIWNRNDDFSERKRCMENLSTLFVEEKK